MFISMRGSTPVIYLKTKQKNTIKKKKNLNSFPVRFLYVETHTNRIKDVLGVS